MFFCIAFNLYRRFPILSPPNLLLQKTSGYSLVPISITLCLVFDKQPGVLSLQSLYIGLEVIHVLNNCSLTQAALEYFDAELKFQFFKPLDLRRTSSSLLVIATNFLRNCLQCLKLKFLLVYTNATLNILSAYRIVAWNSMYQV